jgi:hypothetical protein
MPFEARIRELSDQLANCRDDATALSLAQELQAVMHERIEQLRGEVASCHSLGYNNSYSIRIFSFSLAQNLQDHSGASSGLTKRRFD